MSKSLVQLGKHFDSDKGARHTYLEVYDKLFAGHRFTAKWVLEIGCLAGESLRLWEAYFNKAHIVGLDINPCHAMSSRISCEQRDAYTEQCVIDNRRPYDVIVDDGPHTLKTMQFTIQHYSRLLAPGGTLVVEDINYKAWMPQLAAAVPKHMQRFAYFIDRNFVPGSNSGDDLMLVIDLPGIVEGAP